MRELILTSYGDPYDPRTWSGTPLNLLSALERYGIRVRGLDFRPSRTLRLAKRVGHAVGLPPEDPRAAGSRAQAATHIARHVRLSNSETILHTGTFDLPIPALGSPQRHFLFCDTTWNLWASLATNVCYDTTYVRDADALERASYSQMAHVFPIANYVAQDLVEHYGVEPSRITPVGTGLNVIRPYSGEKDYRSGHILTVAKARFEDKGGRLLLDAFKIARCTRPELHLVVVGSSSNAAFVGNAENVTVTGFVSAQRLQQLFEAAALFAMPALNEPWGLVYLEALACQTPILGLARNALPEITVDGRFGFLVDEASPAAVADTLLAALAAPQRLREMGVGGQAHCLRTYTWDLVAERIAARVFEA